MPMTSGTRIGPYEITGAIGAGGMGEVFRARDTNLNRDVAIKVLPAEFAKDHERVGRFKREAQILASLNNPNIAAIHGLEEDASTGTVALAMEYVEGEDLAQRLARGPIPLDDAIAIARQIAEGLEEAHEHGIIHRDLKPANVKVTSEGKVKILDFGLAKAMEGDPGASGASQLSNSPTLTHQATAAGVILGTAAYMSPEQARGKKVDKRADIWSFGVVLFEMLTGRRLFSGETVSDTLAAVLRADPDWRALPDGTPPAIHRVLRRCLTRESKDRLHDIADARIEITNALGSGSENAGSPSVVGAAVSGGRRTLPWAVASILGIALAAVLARWAPWRPVAGPTPRRLLANAGVEIWRGASAGPSAVLSPDGATLAVVGLRQGALQQLFIRKLDQLQATPLEGTEGAASPFFSPDGRWIGFFADGKLKKVSVTGGAPLPIADARAARGAAWTNDDSIIFMPDVPTGLTLVRVPASGGTPTPFGTMGQGAVVQRFPQALPSGRGVLYTEFPSTYSSQVSNGNVVVASLQGAVPKVVVRGGYSGHYVSSGHLVYLSQGSLFAIRFDLDRLETVGQAVPVLDDVASVGSAGLLNVSADGTLVYEAGQALGLERTLDWVSRDGATSPLSPLSPRKVNWGNPSFSPDGKRLAMEIVDRNQTDVWSYDIASDIWNQLTFDPGNEGVPVWTPDGRRIVFTSDRDKSGGVNLYWMNADGTGEATRLTQSPNRQLPMSWHPSGRFLAFTESAPGNRPEDIMILPMEGSESSGLKPGAPTAFVNTPAAESWARFSPDGRWLAYSSNELGAGGADIFVRPFPRQAGGPRRVSTEGGIAPAWAPSSRELLFLHLPTSRLMFAPYSIEGGVFVPGPPKPWTPVSPQLAPRGWSYALHPDGRRVLMAAGARESRDRLVIFTEFGAYLKKILPETQP